jgi:hypothetical protein
MIGPRPASPTWTPDDDRRLLQMDKDGANRFIIARKLKRTVVAVVRRKSKLRRPKPEAPTFTE